MSEEERLDCAATRQLLADYQLSGKEPLREEVFAALKVKPKLLERKTVFEQVVQKLMDIVPVLEDDMELWGRLAVLAPRTGHALKSVSAL